MMCGQGARRDKAMTIERRYVYEDVDCNGNVRILLLARQGPPQDPHPREAR